MATTPLQPVNSIFSEVDIRLKTHPYIVIGHQGVLYAPVKQRSNDPVVYEIVNNSNQDLPCQLRILSTEDDSLSLTPTSMIVSANSIAEFEVAVIPSVNVDQVRYRLEIIVNGDPCRFRVQQNFGRERINQAYGLSMGDNLAQIVDTRRQNAPVWTTSLDTETIGAGQLLSDIDWAGVSVGISVGQINDETGIGYDFYFTITNNGTNPVALPFFRPGAAQVGTGYLSQHPTGPTTGSSMGVFLAAGQRVTKRAYLPSTQADTLFQFNQIDALGFSKTAYPTNLLYPVFLIEGTTFSDGIFQPRIALSYSHNWIDGKSPQLIFNWQRTPASYLGGNGGWSTPVRLIEKDDTASSSTGGTVGSISLAAGESISLTQHVRVCDNHPSNPDPLRGTIPYMRSFRAKFGDVRYTKNFDPIYAASLAVHPNGRSRARVSDQFAISDSVVKGLTITRCEKTFSTGPGIIGVWFYTIPDNDPPAIEHLSVANAYERLAGITNADAFATAVLDDPNYATTRGYWAKIGDDPEVILIKKVAGGLHTNSNLYYLTTTNPRAFIGTDTYSPYHQGWGATMEATESLLSGGSNGGAWNRILLRQPTGLSYAHFNFTFTAFSDIFTPSNQYGPGQSSNTIFASTEGSSSGEISVIAKSHADTGIEYYGWWGRVSDIADTFETPQIEVVDFSLATNGTAFETREINAARRAGFNGIGLDGFGEPDGPSIVRRAARLANDNPDLKFCLEPSKMDASFIYMPPYAADAILVDGPSKTVSGDIFEQMTRYIIGEIEHWAQIDASTFGYSPRPTAAEYASLFQGYYDNYLVPVWNTTISDHNGTANRETINAPTSAVPVGITIGEIVIDGEFRTLFLTNSNASTHRVRIKTLEGKIIFDRNLGTSDTLSFNIPDINFNTTYRMTIEAKTTWETKSFEYDLIIGSEPEDVQVIGLARESDADRLLKASKIGYLSIGPILNKFTINAE